MRKAASRAKRDGIISEDTPNQKLPVVIGTAESFGGCPLFVLQKALDMIPLYDRCCLGSASRPVCKLVIQLGVGVPCTMSTIKNDPLSLWTPPLKEFMSILLELHLPKICPHASISWENRAEIVGFACESCEGVLRYPPSVLPSLLQIAFSTTARDQQRLRKRCLQFVTENVAPKISAGRLGANAYKLRLKRERLQPAQLLAATDVAAAVAVERKGWAPRCTCEACRRSEGGSVSDDEFGARSGRRKSRGGIKPSRLLQQIQFEDCPFACQIGI